MHGFYGDGELPENAFVNWSTGSNHSLKVAHKAQKKGEQLRRLDVVDVWDGEPTAKKVDYAEMPEREAAELLALQAAWEEQQDLMAVFTLMILACKTPAPA